MNLNFHKQKNFIKLIKQIESIKNNKKLYCPNFSCLNFHKQKNFIKLIKQIESIKNNLN